ncbi:MULTISPECIES: MarR family winged helix-turn-helix transcriptional regulator [Pseudoalteromonas]|uniref:HTH marR-type domain-containing protein n=1 Tax=Pseudoalteromonas aurantia 208 TaxID=1314867 RepID=A0ABR9EG09_9GAMM|nr:MULTISPECIES: MarR family transcriptional regulator [Pseudoalteromonas]MBE0369927.1 hypothetical protein [Pseudoalteromonas aurantia 208]MBQ4850534.1 winged helix DNA-binding protein [Pseudoalteromonas sp. MMG012]
MKDDTYINNLLGAFATTVTATIDEHVNTVGCRSANAATALVTIYNHPDDSIDVLRKILNLTHSGAVRLINGLESEALIERRRSEMDGRSVVIRLTDEGVQRAKQILTARANATQSIMQSITVEQQQLLLPILEQALRTVTHDVSDARKICRLCNEGVCRVQGCPVEQSAVSHT